LLGWLLLLGWAGLLECLEGDAGGADPGPVLWPAWAAPLVGVPGGVGEEVVVGLEVYLDVDVPLVLPDDLGVPGVPEAEAAVVVAGVLVGEPYLYCAVLIEHQAHLPS